MPKKPTGLSCLRLLLTGGLLLSMTACRPSESPSSVPSAQEGPSTPAAPAAVPELPPKTALITDPGAGDFQIARDGKALAAIIVPENPAEKVQAAADDLREYLNEITGAELKIYTDRESPAEDYLLLVGPTRQTADCGIELPAGYPGKEEVIVRRSGNRLILLGNDDGPYTGTQFAVTTLLEYLGCGWFGPDELWQVAPNLPVLAIGELDIRHTPQFRSRWTQVLGQYPEVGTRWYLGGDSTMTGHGIPNMIPRDEYFETHPEWFALVDGKRDPYAEAWWQYDYTNPELAEETAKKLLVYFDHNPHMTNYPLPANDGWEEGWCECETCAAAGNATDQILVFANRVAEIVSRKYPDKTISILSYHNNFFPPEKTKAHPNVEVMFCRETSMTAPLDLEQPMTGYNSITHNTYTQSWLGNFQEFIEKASIQHRSIWEWYCIAAERASWESVPWVQGNVATRNQALWKANGVSYVFYDQGPAESYRESGESFPLRWPLWYVAAKGMWDGSLTGEQILYDACLRLYGEAADKMFFYYKALADSSEQCQGSSICWVPPQPSEMYPSERVELINALVEDAKTMYGTVTADQKARMENQFAIWKQATYYIQMY